MSEIPSQTAAQLYDLIQKPCWDDFHEVLSQSEPALMECNIQVNLESDGSRFLDPQTRKKQKKKEYKKRKREKDQMHEKQAKIELATIIQQIYCQRATLDDRKARIEICLSYLDRGDKFHGFLNQVIRIHVNSVQRKIWEHTQQLLRLHPVQKNDTTLFYYEFASYLCQSYELICKATSEIKNIIRLFFYMTEEKDYLGPRSKNYRNLEKDTFGYLIESDLSLKNLIRICENKLLSKHELQKTHQIELRKLIQLTNDLEIDLGSESQMEEYEESTTTSFDDDQTCSFHTSQKQKESIVQNASGKKSKRKRKIRESDVQPEYEDVLERLQNLEFDMEQRTQCCVEQEWLELLQASLRAQTAKQK